MPDVRFSARRALPFFASGLLMACGQADAPPPASEPKAAVEAAPPAPAEVNAEPLVSERVMVTITYCIP